MTAAVVEGPGLEAWLKSGAYLPEPLRDFHDAKDVFRAMHSIVNVESNDYAAKVSWVAGQCYVIDVFLWFMARRGYTLQRSRQRLPFRSLADDVDAEIATARQASHAHLTAALATAAPPTPDTAL